MSSRIYDRRATEAEINDGYVVDDSELGMCYSCKEHTCPSYAVNDDGTIDDEALSDCCGAGIHLW